MAAVDFASYPFDGGYALGGAYLFSGYLPPGGVPASSGTGEQVQGLETGGLPWARSFFGPGQSSESAPVIPSSSGTGERDTFATAGLSRTHFFPVHGSTGAPPNSPPVWLPLTDLYILPGTPQTFDLSAYVSDPEGDPITIGFVGEVPAGWSVLQSPPRLVYDGSPQAIDVAEVALWASDGRRMDGIAGAFVRASGVLTIGAAPPATPIELTGSASVSISANGRLTVGYQTWQVVKVALFGITGTDATALFNASGTLQ